MQQKHVEITIGLDGSTQVEAINFKGVGCKDATRQIELALAGPGSVVDSKPKDDFWQSTSSGQGLTRGG